MEMPDFIGLFVCLRKREMEQRVWEMWLAKYPYMTEDNFISFEEMLATAQQSDVREAETVYGNYVDQVCL